MSPEPAVILVTGGTGLIGKAIEYTIQNEPEGSRFGKRPGETWIFAGVGEGDLKYVIFSCTYCIVLKGGLSEIRKTRGSSSKSTNQLMSSI